MPRLIVMRHAKSSWDDAGLDDHARPLNGRGRAAAPVMAAWLAARGVRPDRVLCSTAARTRETVALMPGLPEPVLCPALYHAAPETILALLAAERAQTVLVVGHEPGLSALAEVIARPPVIAALAAAFLHFPTAALALFDVADWSGLGAGRAVFTDFVTPRALEG